MNILGNLTRVLLALFAVKLFITSAMFLVGEFVLGIDYMIEPKSLNYALYFFVLFKLISEVCVISTMVNLRLLRYVRSVLFTATGVSILSLAHLSFLHYADSVSREVNEVILLMRMDSVLVILLMFLYLLVAKWILPRTSEQQKT